MGYTQYRPSYYYRYQFDWIVSENEPQKKGFLFVELFFCFALDFREWGGPNSSRIQRPIITQNVWRGEKKKTHSGAMTDFMRCNLLVRLRGGDQGLQHCSLRVCIPTTGKWGSVSQRKKKSLNIIFFFFFLNWELKGKKKNSNGVRLRYRETRHDWKGEAAGAPFFLKLSVVRQGEGENKRISPLDIGHRPQKNRKKIKELLWSCYLTLGLEELISKAVGKREGGKCRLHSTKTSS